MNNSKDDNDDWLRPEIKVAAGDIVADTNELQAGDITWIAEGGYGPAEGSSAVRIPFSTGRGTPLNRGLDAYRHVDERGRVYYVEKPLEEHSLEDQIDVLKSQLASYKRRYG